jgi:predicted molibdopterin-dependent oxidoreductase YjgC
VKLTIDSKEMIANDGETILEAAKRAGFKIPTLCHHPKLSNYGGCRVCVVEIAGMNRLITSCTTPVSEGMVVNTDSQRIRETRKTLLELILSDHPNDCMTCDKTGECTLQDLAYEYGVNIKENPYSGAIRQYPTEDKNPFIIRDFSKCILCAKCVRVCDEVRGVGAIDIMKRGFHAKVAVPFDGVLDCEFCGNCVDVCPVGSLTEKLSKGKGRTWETRKVDTICGYCGVGCGITLHIKDNTVIKITPTEKESVNNGSLCVKGKFAYDFINNKDRLTRPLIKKDGTFVEASWDEAIDYTVKRLKEIKEKYGSDSIGGLSSARCTNEENYLFQKFMRAAIGTNNIDHCARY